MSDLWRALWGDAAATAAAAATTAAGTAVGAALGRRMVAPIVALGQLVVRKAAQVEGLNEGDVGHRVCCLLEGTAARARKCPWVDTWEIARRSASGVSGAGY